MSSNRRRGPLDPAKTPKLARIVAGRPKATDGEVARSADGEVARFGPPDTLDPAAGEAVIGVSLFGDGTIGVRIMLGEYEGKPMRLVVLMSDDQVAGLARDIATALAGQRKIRAKDGGNP